MSSDKVVQSIKDVLLDPQRQAEVVQACVQLVENEVQSKKGLTGMGIKTGFKAVKKFKPDIISQLLKDLLPEFVNAVEPLYQDYLQSGMNDLKTFLIQNKDKVAQQLLNITDARAAKSKHKILVSTYKKLRPLGQAQVIAAIPGLATLLKRFNL
jgi:hypothetical protein